MIMRDNTEPTEQDRSPIKRSRLAFLDGIRGWASIFVLLSHSIACFLALSTPQLDASQERLAQDIIDANYLDFAIRIIIKIITNGRLAVLIFFILSGYTLSISRLGMPRKSLTFAAISRYFRLMIPVMTASFVAYIMLKFGLLYNVKAATIPQYSANWLGTFYTFSPNINDFLAFSLYQVFFDYNGDVTYNPPLWTMQTEMMGSLLILAYLALFRKGETVNWKSIMPLTALLLWQSPLCACFCVGYIVAELNKQFANKPNFIQAKWCQIGLIVIFAASLLLSICFENYEEFDFITFISASLIIFSVSFSRPLTQMLSGDISLFLGKISFPLYLIQIPIICSWSSYLFIRLPQWGFTRSQSNYINLFATIALCLTASILLLPVEKRSGLLAKKITGLILYPFTNR